MALKDMYETSAGRVRELVDKTKHKLGLKPRLHKEVLSSLKNNGLSKTLQLVSRALEDANNDQYMLPSMRPGFVFIPFKNEDSKMRRLYDFALRELEKLKSQVDAKISREELSPKV